ncbi:MAG: MFS transporter, partial [Alphaproteobacteria bacterium]
MPLRRSPRFIALLVLVTVLGPLSMQMFLPALPAIQQGFATDAGTAQLTLTLAMVAIGVATLVFGPLSDRFGRKPVLMAGLVLFFVGS